MYPTQFIFLLGFGVIEFIAIGYAGFNFFYAFCFDRFMENIFYAFTLSAAFLYNVAFGIVGIALAN